MEQQVKEQYCLCGCNEPVRNLYLPGHVNRLHGNIYRAWLFTTMTGAKQDEIRNGPFWTRERFQIPRVLVDHISENPDLRVYGYDAETILWIAEETGTC